MTQSGRVDASEVEAPARLSPLTMAGLLAGPFLTMLDSSVVNVAVPVIGRSLHTDLATIQWTVSGYLLALATMLAASAWLMQRFGTRPVYLASMAGFTAASVLCALAPSVQFLVAARALQGFAGAPLTPIAMSMIMGGGSGSASRQVQRGAAAAAIVLFMAPAAGPTLGGVLIQAYGWPSIFLINVPFGILGLIGALHVAGRFNLPPDPSARFDAVGLSLLAAGTALALYGAGQGASHHWTDPAIWPFWASGLLLVALYVAWAWRRPAPALSLAALRDRRGALTMGLATLVSVVSFSALFLVPVLMQSVQGYSAIQAGLAMLPQGLVMGLGSVLGAAVTSSGRVRLSVLAGSLVLVGTTAAMLLIGAGTPGWETALILCGRGLAFGLITQPLLVGMMGSLSRAASADASTLFNVIQRLGGSFGIGLLGSLFAVRAGTRVQEALHGLGISAQGSGGSLTDSAAAALASAPAPVRKAVQDALATSFHDVVWALVAVSALGIVLAVLLRDPPKAVAA
jgi:EmrB/QacA subfamily drug resistance transporter